MGSAVVLLSKYSDKRLQVVIALWWVLWQVWVVVELGAIHDHMASGSVHW